MGHYAQELLLNIVVSIRVIMQVIYNTALFFTGMWSTSRIYECCHYLLFSQKQFLNI